MKSFFCCLAVLTLASFLFGQDAPYSIKGFTVGETTLQDFKTQFHHCADNCDARGWEPKFASFCSDTFSAAAVDADGHYIRDVPAHTQAGLVYCQPYFPFEQMRGQHFTIAEVPATTEFDFYQNKLYRVAATFYSASFSGMQGALSAKYGAPASITTAEYQNAFGAKFSGTVATWENTVSKIILTQYSRSRDYSGLVIEHKALASQAASAIPKQIPKDL